MRGLHGHEVVSRDLGDVQLCSMVLRCLTARLRVPKVFWVI